MRTSFGNGSPVSRRIKEETTATGAVLTKPYTRCRCRSKGIKQHTEIKGGGHDDDEDEDDDVNDDDAKNGEHDVLRELRLLTAFARTPPNASRVYTVNVAAAAAVEAATSTSAVAAAPMYYVVAAEWKGTGVFRELRRPPGARDAGTVHGQPSSTLPTNPRIYVAAYLCSGVVYYACMCIRYGTVRVRRASYTRISRPVISFCDLTR